jgi:hypothetical protein
MKGFVEPQAGRHSRFAHHPVSRKASAAFSRPAATNPYILLKHGKAEMSRYYAECREK